MRQIKLHWSRSKPNFGDWLSPAICEAAAKKPVVYSSVKRCDMIAVGSILHRAKGGLLQCRIHVWGSGFISKQEKQKSKHYFHAVRGAYTSKLITNHDITIFGDPGLLAELLLPNYASHPIKRFTLGLIPHYKDKNSPLIKDIANDLPRTCIIDVFDDPLAVLKQILQCEFILSSSMHGLVVADAFGIPNAWIELFCNVRGGGWKYKDYYSAFGLEGVQPFPISKGIDASGLDQIAKNWQRPNIDQVKKQLYESFPFPAGRES